MIGETRLERELLARDYVLGLLSADEAADIQRLLLEDEALRTEIATLGKRLLELDYAAAPEAVPDDLWGRIEGRLGDQDRKILPLPSRKSAEPMARVGYWKGFATAAVAASLLFAAATGAFVALRPTPEPLVIAVLVDEEANPGVIVEAFGENRVRIVPLVDISVPPDRALEVWTLPDPETGPVSLGLLAASAEASLAGFDLPRPNVDQLYEITLEPATGSPVGRPTGPILFKGFAKTPR